MFKRLKEKATSTIETAKQSLNKKIAEGIIPDINLPDVNLPSTDLFKRARQKLKELPDKLPEIKKPRLPLEKITQVNFFKRINQMNIDLENLKNWREIRVEPSLFDIFNRIKNDIYPTLITAKDLAVKSAETAQKSYEFAKTFIMKLQLAGETMKYAMEDVSLGSQTLFNEMARQMKRIRDSMEHFGVGVVARTKPMYEEAVQLGKEMAEAVYEIGIPLKYCADEASDFANELSDAKRAIDNWRPLVFAERILKAAKSAKNSLEVLIYKSYEGQGSVLYEINEGLNEISREMQQFGNATMNFGNFFLTGMQTLGGEFNIAITGIRREVNYFTETFKRAFGDVHTVFTKEWTDKEIAKLRLERGIEREKYMSFEFSILKWEEAGLVCQELRDETFVYDQAIINAKNQKAAALEPINKKITTQQSITDFWVNTRYPAIVSTFIHKVYPIHPVNLIQALRDHTRYFPTGSYYYDYEPDLLGSHPCYGDNRYYGGGHGNRYCGGTTRVGVHVLYANLWLSKYHDKDYYQMLKHVNVLKALKTERAKIIKEYDILIAKNETDLQNHINKTKAQCIEETNFYNTFKTKWGMPPDDARELTYEEIINL